jgi:UDPglucose 6-dehydrogenase
MEKIFCIGLGKLGLIFSQILAEYDNEVYGYDSNVKIEKDIKNNHKNSEPKLNYLINKNRKRFIFTRNIREAVNNTNSSFILVPTPSKKNFEFDNQYIINTLNIICPFLKYKKNYLINITSTVNPGSCDYFIKYIEDKFFLKHGIEFIITYNPHLIALGSIYDNVINSDLVIAGSNIPNGHKILKKIYKNIYKKKISKLKFLSLKEAEIAKIAINSYVTMKISFTNTISQIADSEKNINASNILDTIGLDKRIGNKYLSLGAFFSGPCFPRDNLNFTQYLKKVNIKPYIPIAIDNVNNLQIYRYINFFKKYKNFLNKKISIGICGLTYKNNTNVTTNSPGEKLLKYFQKKYYTLVYNKIKPDTEYKYNYTNDLREFFTRTNFIFICYKDFEFKKIENFYPANKKVVVDLWNFLNIKKKKILLKKAGVS